jgi:hypothetical protein
MFGRLIRRPWFWIGLIAVFIAALVVAGCGNPQQATPRPVVCATYQDEQGVWREEDHERVDSDPCDRDDLFEVKTTAPAKPKPAVSPAKPNVRNTRR